MQTMRKQFTGWLPEDSARQSEVGSISDKNGCLSEGTMPRDWLSCPTSTKNLPWKLVKTSTQTEVVVDYVET